MGAKLHGIPKNLKGDALDSRVRHILAERDCHVIDLRDATLPEQRQSSGKINGHRRSKPTFYRVYPGGLTRLLTRITRLLTRY